MQKVKINKVKINKVKINKVKINKVKINKLKMQKDIIFDYVFFCYKISAMDLLDNAFPSISYNTDIKGKKFKQIDLKKGTFGDVSIIAINHTLHVMKKINFTEGLFEIIILKKLYNDHSRHFLPKLLKIDIIDNDLIISMTYCGRDLHTLTKTISEENRIQLIPSMLRQILNILNFLQENNIIHGDIKPQNITMTANKKIYLIDFGFATPYNKYTQSYSGTYEFSHPNYLTWEKQIDYSYDIYSFAMTLIFFITKKYINCAKFTTMDKKWIVDVNIPIYINELKAIFNKQILSKIDVICLDCIKKMMCVDSNNIMDPSGIPPSPKQLYQNVASVASPTNGLRTDINIKNISENINLFIADICLIINSPQLFQYAQILFIKLNPKRRPDLYALACIIIGNYIFHSIEGDYFDNVLEDASEIINGKYSKNEILKAIFEIGGHLNWNLYPKIPLEDWNKNIQDMTIYPYIIKLTAKKTIELIISQSIGNIII